MHYSGNWGEMVGQQTLQPAQTLVPSVLVVDDEPMVLDVMQGMLEVLGCQVRVCDSGYKAVEVLDTQAEAFDLVFCDLTLGGLQGRRLFERIRGIAPQLRTVVMSGRIESDQVEEFRELGISGFLSKPFNIDSLRSEIDRVMLG